MEVPAAIHSELVAQLIGARIDAARAKLADQQPRPGIRAGGLGQVGPVRGKALAETILEETVWNLSALALNHRLPVDQVALAKADVAAVFTLNPSPAPAPTIP